MWLLVPLKVCKLQENACEATTHVLLNKENYQNLLVTLDPRVVYFRVGGERELANGQMEVMTAEHTTLHVEMVFFHFLCVFFRFFSQNVK